MTVAIIAIYMVAMLAIGLLLRKRVRLSSDFLVAGRRLGLVFTTATLAAVQIGAGVILGGAELGAEHGVWPGMWNGLGCGGGLILAGLFVASHLRRRGSFVPMDFFGERYGERKGVRLWAWLSNIPSLLGVYVAQIMATGSIFTLFGFSYTEGVVISGAVIAIYSTISGMWGVAGTDLVQVGIILIGLPFLALTAAELLEQSGEVSLSGILSTAFIPDGMAPRAVFIILPFFLSISVSYDAYMRFQSARSEGIARWGSVLSGLIVIAISFCAGLAGAVGRVLYPELEPGTVFPQVIQDSLSPVMAGIVLSALLAATMSTANALLISIAGSCARDFYNKVLHPSGNLDELKHSKAISRVVVIVASIAGVLIALQAKGILFTMIIFNYPYMGSMLVPLLGGVLWRGATLAGAVAAMVIGGVIGVVSFIVGVVPGPLYGWFNIDLGLLVAYLASSIAFVLVSLRTRS